MNSQIAAAMRSPSTISIDKLRELANHDAELLGRPARLATVTEMGAYPLVYFGSDADTDFIYPICPKCANGIEYGEERGLVELAGAEAYMEGPDMPCETNWSCELGEMISSAYGDPDEEAN